jgi:hypothetical protein
MPTTNADREPTAAPFGILLIHGTLRYATHATAHCGFFLATRPLDGPPDAFFALASEALSATARSARPVAIQENLSVACKLGPARVFVAKFDLSERWDFDSICEQRSIGFNEPGREHSRILMAWDATAPEIEIVALRQAGLMAEPLFFNRAAGDWLKASKPPGAPGGPHIFGPTRFALSGFADLFCAQFERRDLAAALAGSPLAPATRPARSL